jgi:uncharacterized membrane protein
MFLDPVLRRVEPLLLRVDRIAGGRNAHEKIVESDRDHHRTVRAFRWVFWLLAVELLIGFAAVVIAVALFYFAWRAALGWRWAYQRLRLFAQIFPVITLVMAAIPGLYPAWMVTEQIVFSLIMIGIADFLTSDHMRRVYRKPDADPASAT